MKGAILRELGMERADAARLQRRMAALGNDEGALPVVATVQRHQEVAARDVAGGGVGVAGLLGNAHPQHIDGRAVADVRQRGGVAQRGMPAVGGHHQRGVQLDVLRLAGGGRRRAAPSRR
jgi:hypothetical protein